MTNDQLRCKQRCYFLNKKSPFGDFLLENFKESVEWYYKENEYYFECRKRDLLEIE